MLLVERIYYMDWCCAVVVIAANRYCMLAAVALLRDRY